MRKNGLVRIATLLLFCCVLFGCGKGKKGSIYGIVIDLGTDEPVANAMVQLLPCGETRLTGYDGIYEFLDVEDGDYSLMVSKTEYDELEDDFVIKVRNGEQIRRDVRIEKLPVIYTNEVTDLISLEYSSGNVVTCNVTLNGYVASVGSPAYMERGFHCGINHNYFAELAVPGNEIGNYSITVTVSANMTYWVRAYVKTSSNQWVFGQEIVFSTYNLE